LHGLDEFYKKNETRRIDKLKLAKAMEQVANFILSADAERSGDGGQDSETQAIAPHGPQSYCECDDSYELQDNGDGDMVCIQCGTVVSKCETESTYSHLFQTERLNNDAYMTKADRKMREYIRDICNCFEMHKLGTRDQHSMSIAIYNKYKQLLVEQFEENITRAERMQPSVLPAAKQWSDDLSKHEQFTIAAAIAVLPRQMRIDCNALL
jgi:hypothetical protein